MSATHQPINEQASRPEHAATVGDPDVTLREARPSDWPRLRSWISRPDVTRWFGSPSALEAELRVVFETQSAIARIIEVDAVPVGYVFAIDATHWGSDLPKGLPPGTWDIDVVVSKPGYRGRGVGSAALEAISGEVFATTFAMALCVFISVRNEPMVRAYERAGFNWARVCDDPAVGPTWMMLRERP